MAAAWNVIFISRSPLPALLRMGIVTWPSRSPKDISLSEGTVTDSGRLFPGMNGDRFAPRSVQHIVGALAARAGIKASPHTLRHTSCHELAETGRVPLDRVALLAGHATASGLSRLRTTIRYTLPGQEDLKKAVERIEW